MALWSAVTAKDVLRSDRLDADYYKPADLEALRRVRSLGGSALGAVCSIQNGKTPLEYCENGSHAVVRSGDLVSPLIWADCGRAFLRTTPGRGAVRLKAGDVLISSIGLGSIGKISLVIDPAGLCTVSEVTILRDSEYPPEYLWAYLSTRAGQSQIEREVTGATGQQHLLKSKVQGIVIPPPTKGMEATLKRSVASAVQSAKIAGQSYAEAEALLVSTLGLDKLDLTPQLFYERSYKDTAETARLDAEYYQPPKWRVLGALAKMPGRAVGEQYRSIRSLWQPDKAGAGARVRNYDLTDALGPFLDETLEPAKAGEIGSTKKRLQAGDLVLSRLRSYLKEIAVVLPWAGVPMVGSTEFIVLRPNMDALKIEALLVYLRSRYIQTVLKWCQDGSNHPRFDENEVLRLRIPKPIADIEDDLAELVRMSIAGRREARRLLEEAKALVEKAIMPANAGAKR